MRCRYCFYADFGNGRGLPSLGVMSQETLERAIEKILAAGFEVCTLEFQGGEPTLAGLSLFKSLIELEKIHNRNNVEVQHTLVTNGLAIDAEWAAFLAENAFSVTVSLDAAKQHHDDLRPDENGKGTHSRALDAVRLLEKNGVHVTLQTVLTKSLASHPDKTYRYFVERGFRHLRFIPCLLPPDGAELPYSLDQQTYGKFLTRVFDLWHADFVKGEYVSIGIFDLLVHQLAGQGTDLSFVTGRPGNALAIESDGSVLPADRRIDREALLGNVHTDDIATLLERVGNLPSGAGAGPRAEGSGEFGNFALYGGMSERERDAAHSVMPCPNDFSDAYAMLFDHALPRLRDLAKKLYTIYET